MERPSQNSAPRWLDAVVWLAVATVVVVAGYACWCRTPLLWDGSYQFAETLRAGSPYAYLSRFHTRILWQPVVWLMPFTDNVRLLQAVYGLPFMLAPAVGLAVCWWFVRRQMPTLIVWAAMGILATPLPGQIFVINDSIFQQHLFWPVFFGLLVQMTRRQKAVWAVLAVFQFVHQIGLILLAVAALTTLILPWERGRPRPLVARIRGSLPAIPAAFAVAALLALLMAAKVWWTSIPGTAYYDSYAAREATWQFAKDRWWKSVWGYPLNGLRMIWLAGGVICLQAWLFTLPKRESAARMCAAITMVALVAGVLNWTTWADSPIAWGGAIEYRRWLVPMTMPVFILAAIEAWWRVSRTRKSEDQREPAGSAAGVSIEVRDAPLQDDAVEDVRAPIDPMLPLRAAVILLLTCVYAIVICRQSTQVNEMTSRLEAEIAASPTSTIVLPADHWLRGTPLDHWSLGWQSLVLQGKTPTKWVAPTDLPAEKLEALHRGRLPVDKFVEIDPNPGATGWFDLRRITSRQVDELPVVP
ncbi:hypothetical protein [Humisphaera borealis]|uniref:Uncharacterized protein n=1 Tax=Humisphaera borealis TaxID=2807512 RepID=A0A7M2WVQ5_9BACT|nr:hypothetical protein [Humisphaera borealis]QOV89312.1 hypothetical protein IPV69_24405 [Humisphaera borealis]